MKFSKLLFAVVGATVLLGALVGSASARSFSVSSDRNRASFARMDFAGGFGTVECEVVLEGTFHSRTQVKSVGTLIGLITAGTVTRCARGGATIDQASLPWHRRYAGFTGTLPNIATQSETVSGASWRVREPAFGITCQVSGATAAGGYTRGAGGAITEAAVSGTASCSGINGTLSGRTTNVDDRSGNRITITLI